MQHVGSLLVSQPWMTKAACRDHPDPDAWHLDKYGTNGKYAVTLAERTRLEMARSLCAVCPVLEDCREYGKTQEHGMYGGLMPQERKRRKQFEMQLRIPLERPQMPSEPREGPPGYIVLQKDFKAVLKAVARAKRHLASEGKTA